MSTAPGRSPSITIDNVYPWGRSFDEYRRMFSLGDDELNRRILSCADGPAAFNARMWASGRRVVSCDPLYAFSRDEIRRRIAATREVLVSAAQTNAGLFVWNLIKTPEELGRLRRAAMTEFLRDFDAGRAGGRYVCASLPTLPFADGEFDLALCSHFLFLYSEELSAEFHVAAVSEMCRVAADVRIFPLLDMKGRPSAHLETVIAELTARGFDACRQPVEYEFQRGGHTMLRIRSG